MPKKQLQEARLLDALKVQKKLSTEQTMELLGISASSARRLFLSLEESGNVLRTYGGVQLAPAGAPEYSFTELESRNLHEKQQIAERAAGLICEDDVVYFDGGTTLFQLAIVVRRRLQSGELSHVRVVTNSYANMQILNDCCDVILIGGIYRARRKDFAGYASERFVQCFNYKKAFLGADGFDVAQGFMATDADTAKLNEVLLKRSQECYVLMDSSKFRSPSFISYAGAADVGAVITDANLDELSIAACKQANFSVLIASPD